MHALRGWRAHRHLVIAIALTLSVLLVALVAVQSVASTARAAVTLLCDQQTLYSVASTGSLAGKLSSIDVSGDTGNLTATDVQTFDTANNALGLSTSGLSAYAVRSTGTLANGNYTTVLQRTDAGATPVTVSRALPVPTYTATNGNTTAYTIIRGAVDPANGVYYYATGTVTVQGGTTQMIVMAYDLKNNTPIGQIGQINGTLPATTTINGQAAGANGDLAFSTSGDLFVVGANQVVRVDDLPQTASTSRVLDAKKVATLDSTVNSPGIAFTSDGFLYVTNGSQTTANNVTTYSTNVIKLNPATGVQVWNRTVTGNVQSSDLATCNFPDTVTNQVSVDHRWNATDQFTVSLVSADDSQAATPATTSGSSDGLQTAKAGAILTVPGRKYTVSQAAAGTTDLSNYTTTWACVDQNDEASPQTVIAKGSGVSGSVTVPSTPVDRRAGTEVVCTFTNALKLVHVGPSDDTYTTPVNVAVEDNVLTNDAGTGNTAAVKTQPSHGSVSLASDGSFTYTPTNDYSGKDSFTYTATDGSGQASDAKVTITITPTAADDTITTTPGTAGTVTVTANDHGSSLPAGATVTTQPTKGTASIDANGVATYTPTNASFSGKDSFTYTVTDPDGGSATATVNVVVAPTAAPDTISVVVGGTGSTSLLANDKGSNLTVTNVSKPTNGTVTVAADGTATYTPTDPNFSGTDSFTYTVTDGTTTSQPATVSVTVGPKAKNDTYRTPANTQLDVAAPGVLSNDGGSTLSVTGNTTPVKGGTVTLNADGSFSYKPAKDFSGDDSFQYTAKDKAGTTTKATVTITVTPTAADDTIATTAGTPGTVTVTANDHGSSLTATVTKQPANGTVSIDKDGVATYTPNDGTSGKDSFTYTVTDPSGNTATGTVTVTVAPRAVADTLATTAGESESIDVTANDEGAGLTVADLTQPAHGTVSVDPETGVVTYGPTDASFSGTDTFTYTVTDGTTTSKPATVTVTVGPKANDDTAATTANTPVTVDAKGVLANDQGSNASVTKNTDPTAEGGTATVNADGSFTYTPPTDFSGTDSFDYTLTADGGSATATVTVTVKPTATDGSITTTAGTPGTTNVLADSHGTGLVPTVTQPANGTATVTADGTVTYTPKPGTSGPDTFTYTVTDKAGNTATGTIAVTVAPTAATDRIQSLADEAGSVNLLANDSGSALHVTDHSLPEHGQLVIADDGTATFTPDAGWSGNTSFTYTVTDAARQTATATAYITVGVVTKNDAYSTTAGTPVQATDETGVLANDRGEQLTATPVANRGPQHGDVTLHGDGSFTYVPVDGFSGTDTFQYTATDPDGTRARGTVTITVTPTVSSPAIDDPAGAPTTGRITVNGSGTTTTVSKAPGHGTVTLGDDGSYTYTPAPGFSGDDSFDVTVTDSSGQKSTVTVPVTVTPTAVDDAFGTPANTKLVVAAAKGLIANDHGTGLRVTGLTAPTHGTVSIGLDGSFVYTPAKGWSGTDAFTYTVTDAAGRTATATATIAVGMVTAPDTATATADTALTVDAEHGVLANDGGTGLTAAKATDPAHGTVVVGKDGSYTYTPATGYSGPDSFTYTATDANGVTKTDTVRITVLPKAVDDAYRTPTGHALDVVAPGVLGNDSGTSIRVTAVGTLEGGTATITADGTVHYVPVAGFSGTDSFAYTITDATGGTATATVTVSVRPYAARDTQSTGSGVALTTTPATGVLANDLGTGLTVTGHTDPTHGTLVLEADGSGTYTPETGFSGTDTYTYTIADQAGQTSTTTVVVVVGPMATADAGTTPANTTLTVIAPGVLGNDAGTGLTATVDLAPTHGTLVLGTDGSYTYVPTEGYSGTDVFTYTATDASGDTTTGVVTITVTPKATKDAYRTPANTALTLDADHGPLMNDVGRRLRVVAVADPKHGTTTLGATGAFVYTPVKGFSGTDTFDYTIEDVTGARATTTITVTVLPTAKDDRYTAIGGRTLTITPGKGILGDDAGSGLWAQVASQPEHGTVTLAADGSFVYTPAAGYHGADSFTYTTTDAEGNTATATVYLTVATPAAAKDDRAHGKPGKPTTIDVLRNDTPTSGATFDKGSLTLVNPTTKGIGATVTVQGQGDWAVQDGKLVFTPARGFSGTAHITYRVTDADGVTVQAVATVDYPTPAQVTAKALAYTGGASLGWLALVAAGVIAIGAVLRRRRGDAEPGPRRTGN
ncbi:MAG: tandem-95 repeat protein [Williamsia herbipolensis]|nr:tandem-95 repeat protein [Williamsia herbipolensis]